MAKCAICNEHASTRCESCQKAVCYGCTTVHCDDADICKPCAAQLAAEERES